MDWDYQTTYDTFIRFFQDRQHTLVDSTSLRPPVEDTSVLFVTSGMHPLTPFLLGQPHHQGQRLVNMQRCLRTTDLDEVGDNTHLTMFNMLGNWSLGDYDRSQSLQWSYQFLVEVLGVDPQQLHVTIWQGDETVPRDELSYDTWRQLGLRNDQITGTVDDNWWSNGPTGPCGPDSEIFVWTGDGPPQHNPVTDDRWVEIWNVVSMMYDRQPDGSILPLPQQNVDTGMGFERLLMMLQGVDSVYETDLLRVWTQQISNQYPSLSEESVRLVSDHLRSCMVMVGDGIVPSNTGQGYVLRRLLRRVLHQLWLQDDEYSLLPVPEILVQQLNELYYNDDVSLLSQHVSDVLQQEETKTRKMLLRGRQQVDKLLQRGPLTNSDYQFLFETHGLPPEFVQEMVVVDGTM